ncbi:hypothetical protein O181_126478 [Austropuccinia psidii MF-1]|uniref:Uncharacterized protein n=1 Tax=Austropuccinia psidii MF-1 TaxID=1389203 RepID=A0A9Q3KSI8_9BASI|nr:hypothetical protein [Austropuccinia psidii MF-1]
MSREHQANLISYANLFTSPKILFKIQFHWNPYVQSISTASTGLYLILVLRSAPFKVGGTVTTTNNHPPNVWCSNSSLNTVYGAYGPSIPPPGPLAQPLILWGFGLNSLFGPFRPSTARVPQFMGPLGPFWPKSNGSKGAKGAAHQVPNHKWDHLSQLWPQNPTSPEMAKPPCDPKLAKNHKWPQFSPWPLETTRGHQLSSNQGFSSSSGDEFSFLNAPALKDPGVVHIWYNIPLCTIFAQKSNGDIFRTKLHDSKSSHQSITNFEGVFSSYSVWQFPGGYQKTIQGPQPPGPAGIGLSILISTVLRAILRGYKLFI